MNTTSQVIQFIYDKTHGVVNLTMKDADTLIGIITNPVCKDGRAKKSFYNAQIGTYEFIRTIPVTQEQINAAIHYALENGPTKQFYLYELYNAAGESEGVIYSIDSNIFE